MQVKLINYMGSDLTVVNAARVSFNKRSKRNKKGELHRNDISLINFLARGMTNESFENILEELDQSITKKEELINILNKYRNTPTHWTPFAHPQITFYIKAPIFISEQLKRHTVGAAWNEVSRRYVDDTPEFYFPSHMRSRAKNNKQGSSDEKFSDEKNHQLLKELTTTNTYILKTYKHLISEGVAPELARIILPQNMFTEWHWTGSLYFFANLCKQRLDSHTQYENRLIAQEISEKMKSLFPVSWAALIKG